MYAASISLVGLTQRSGSNLDKKQVNYIQTFYSHKLLEGRTKLESIGEIIFPPMKTVTLRGDCGTLGNEVTADLNAPLWNSPR